MPYLFKLITDYLMLVENQGHEVSKHKGWHLLFDKHNPHMKDD